MEFLTEDGRSFSCDHIPGDARPLDQPWSVDRRRCRAYERLAPESQAEHPGFEVAVLYYDTRFSHAQKYHHSHAITRCPGCVEGHRDYMRYSMARKREVQDPDQRRAHDRDYMRQYRARLKSRDPVTSAEIGGGPALMRPELTALLETTAEPFTDWEENRLRSVLTLEGGPGNSEGDGPMSRCSECQHEAPTADLEERRLYECGECGLVFASDWSNRCDDCGRFASKIADIACPECEQGAMEPLEAPMATA